MKKHDLPTPAAVIDLDVMEKNIRAMSERAREAGVKLRPHVKTHKIPAIARMQVEAGAAGITCAKASEAAVMAKSGIRDILIAFPVVGEIQIEMIMKLLEDCSVTLAFDSLFGAGRIDSAARKRGITVNVYMIVNSGLDRDGVSLGDETFQLASRASEFKNIRINGIMTHEGHVYSAKTPEEVKKLATEAGQGLVETAGILRSHGFPVENVSMGSTPACRMGVAVDGITEWRPGTYVFNDVHEFMLATPVDECAFSLIGTVVSNPAAGRYILDTGSKTLAADKIVAGGYGFIREAPLAVIERLSEEHAVVRAENQGNMQLGQRVEIIPNHVCTAVNLLDRVYACRGEDIIDEWIVEARGKTI